MKDAGKKGLVRQASQAGNVLHDLSTEALGSQLGTLIEKTFPALAGLLKTAVAQYGWAFGGVGLLILFLFTKLRSHQDSKEAETALKQILSSIEGLGDRINPLLEEQNNRAQIVEILKEGIDFSALPKELAQDSQFMIELLFSDRQEQISRQQTDEILDRIGEPTLREMAVTYSGRLFDLPHGPLREGLTTEFISDQQVSLSELISQVQRQTQLHLQLSIPGPEGPLKDRQDMSAPSRLIFSERLVPKIFGRAKEMKELDEFLQDPEAVRWWLWYGAGGLGKSRLALEWLWAALGKGWTGGFLNGGFPAVEELMGWTPEHPTIFVIDYAAGHAESCRDAIAHFADQAEGNPNYPKIRVLMLERSFSPNDAWVETLGRKTQSAKDQKVRKASFRKGLDRNPEGRLLDALNIDDFVETFKIAYFNACGKQLSPRELQKARTFFESEDFRKRRLRPLYAGLCALIAAERDINSIHEWRAADLEEYVLSHEASIWKEQVGASQADVHAVFVATIIDGITHEDWKTWPPHTLVKDANEANAKRVASHSEAGDRVIPGILPDLVGEAFVRMRLKGELYNGCGANTVRTQSEILLDYLLGIPGEENA